MKYRLTIGLLLALLGLTACTGTGTRPVTRLRLSDFASGLPVSGHALTYSKDRVQLAVSRLPAEGLFLHLELEPGQTVVKTEWSDTAGLLQLVVPLPGGADIGVMPLPEWQEGPLGLTLKLGPSPRSISTAPTGSANALIDLALEPGGSSQVRLSWTEVNRGDYDFNGVVNIADLKPLGQRFGSTLDISSNGKYELPVYWTDGNLDGEVGFPDLTVIAQNYQSEVHGYNVLRNGSAQPGSGGTTPSILRTAATSRQAQQLPPRYVLVLNGSPVDDWNVLPVDSGLSAGISNQLPPIPVDFSSKLSTTGLTLYNLDGSGQGQTASGRCSLRIVDVWDIMRRIDPGDDINAIEIGTSIGATSGNAGFTGLPRGQWLLLQVLFAPTVDPVSGTALSWGDPPSYRALHIPIRLPLGSALSELTASLAFTQQPGGSYRVRIASNLMSGSQRIQTISELDYASLTCAVDSDGDQSFAGELRLPDPLHHGLSTARLQQLCDDNDYQGGTRQTAQIAGRFESLNLADGTLVSSANVLTLDGVSSSQPSLVSRFSELASVTEEVLTVSGVVKRDIAPAELMPGDQLRLGGYRLDGVAGLPPRQWLTSIVRITDLSKPDKLYAWPDKTEVYPGEAVTITVSSDQSAHPFRELRGVRITFNNADYVFDSFNAGAPGGTRSGADGLWAALGATALTVPTEGMLTLTQLPDNRKALDFFVLPQDGAVLASASGDLFNFKLSVMGPLTIGIQRTDIGGVKRSYYADDEGNEWFWGDDYNAGVPMVTVKDPGGPGGPG